MLATVTNKGRGARGFATLDRGVVLLEAGASAVLDLAEHALHRAWAASGEVLLAPLADKEARAVRRRLEADAEALSRHQAEALAALGPAPKAERPVSGDNPA